MLDALGVPSLDALVDQTIPAAIRLRGRIEIGEGVSEDAALAKLRAIASENRVLRSCLGMGYHPCVVPGVIQSNVLENPAWYTAYTPYQAEIAQGRLEALINFQTMVTDLTGLPVANASLLDEGTAAAEAMAICLASARGSRRRFFVDDGCHPQTLEVVETRAWALGVEVVTGDHRELMPDARAVRRPAPVPDLDRIDPRLRAVDRARPRRRRARGGGRRSARARPAAPARRDGRRHRRRLDPALRRADGLRRTARRLHGDARRAQAPAAGPRRRRVARRARSRRLPALAADPRAAHPPREGDLEHLHRAGAARGARFDVRRLPRQGRPRAHRERGARAGAPARRRAGRARPSPGRRAVLRHARGHDRRRAAPRR